MNTLLKYSLAALLGLGSVNIASAAFISDTTAGALDGTNVGSIDTFIAEAAKANGEAAETAWVNLTLSTTGFTFDSKMSTVPYYLTDAIGYGTALSVYAFAFNPAPGDDYFLIKNSTRMALFRNLADLDYGVFDTALLSSDMKLLTDDFTISHVSSIIDPNSTPVIEPGPTIPEPTSIYLIGTGLLGLFGASLKKS